MKLIVQIVLFLYLCTLKASFYGSKFLSGHIYQAHWLNNHILQPYLTLTTKMLIQIQIGQNCRKNIVSNYLIGAYNTLRVFLTN